MIRRLPIILGVAGILAGCAPGPSAAPAIPSIARPPTEQIVVLAGTVGAMTLVAPDSAGQLTDAAASSPAGLPANAAWLSSDGSELLATTLDGRVLIGSPGSPTAWQAASADRSRADPMRAFGSLGPKGQVAFVEGDPGAGTPGRLVVETLAGTVQRVIALPTAAEGPAAWLPDGRIALIARDEHDAPETLLIDAAGRTSRLATPPLRSIAIGGGIVTEIDVTGALSVGNVNAWLAVAQLQEVETGGRGESEIQAQPSPSGAELAVVVADPEGDAVSILVLAAAGGWHAIVRFGLPDGANRAVVSWLAVR